jgi:hypothetical protein
MHLIQLATLDFRNAVYTTHLHNYTNTLMSDAKTLRMIK